MSTPQYTPKDVVRFWSKVDKSGGDDACWIWTAGCLPKGYGRFSVGGRIQHKDVLAHRFSYLIAHGSLPSDLLVCHSCDTPRCVNPSHLFLGTHGDNNRDASVKGRSAFGARNGWHTHPHDRRNGERHPMHKLTTTEVDEIRHLYQQGGVTQRALAERFSVCQTHIGCIVRGTRWHAS